MKNTDHKPLAPNDFLFLITHAPLIAIDLVVSDGAGRALLGLRRNQPAQGFWFVPGGRIFKDERLAEAFRRICLAELGQELEMEQARFLGVFEHLYPPGENVFGQEGISTHYINLGYALAVDAALPLPPAQHSDYRWWPVEELMRAGEVHENTKKYFEFRE